MKKKLWWSIGVTGGAALLVLGLGFWFANTDSGWFRMLLWPVFTPPLIGFGIMGIALMALWSVSAVRLSLTDHPRRSKLLTLYGVHALCMLFWPFTFFQLQSPTAAFMDQAAMLILALGTGYRAYQTDRIAGVVMIPVALWEAFVLTVNYMVALMN